MDQQGSLRRRYKSRSGCITCKKRKLKCDEAEPSCTRCVRAHLICPGYARPVKWSTKYEIDYGPLTYAGPSSNRASDSSLSDRLETASDHGSSPFSLYTPQQESTILLLHYFSSTCRVASSFDSAQSPYRSFLSEMIRQSPIIFNCVMGMSAAHLGQQDRNTSITPLTFQTEAISHISREISLIESTEQGLIPQDNITNQDGSSRFTVKQDLLLGIITLGMTSSWYDPSSLGLCHFHGARQLFKIWIAESDMTELQLPTSSVQRLIVSSMVYWEVMASCLIDQDIKALSYLDIFCTLPPAILCYPSPWTGVGLFVLIQLAKCITLVRQSRHLHHLKCTLEETSSIRSSYFRLTKKAFILAHNVDQNQVPPVEEIQETEDPVTPTSHLYKIAHCYRLVSRLELYRAFPDLGDDQSSTEVGYDQINLRSQQVIGLAIEILEIIQSIPDESGTIAIQTLIFLSAGSVLAISSTMDTATSTLIFKWREFVLQRFYKSYQCLKLETIRRVATVLKQVWSRMDLLAGGVYAIGCKSPIIHVHWIDIMKETNLETILG